MAERHFALVAYAKEHGEVAGNHTKVERWP
jgi:hypothetical protein